VTVELRRGSPFRSAAFRQLFLEAGQRETHALPHIHFCIGMNDAAEELPDRRRHRLQLEPHAAEPPSLDRAPDRVDRQADADERKRQQEQDEILAGRELRAQMRVSEIADADAERVPNDRDDDEDRPAACAWVYAAGCPVGRASHG
jgi:hypothetical protein